MRSRSRRAFYDAAAFPSRRKVTRATSHDSPFETALTALQARRKTRPRKSSTDRDAACGRRLDPTAVCGGGRWTTTLGCAGRITPSEGPPLRRLLPQYDVGKEFPSSSEPFERPFLSSTFRSEGWIDPSSSCVDQGSRLDATPRRATPSGKPGHLPPSGILRRKDHSLRCEDRHHP